MNAEQMRRESGDNPLRALLIEHNPSQLELPLPPVPMVHKRLMFVEHCRHCGGIHFTYSAYMECVMAANDAGQRE